MSYDAINNDADGDYDNDGLLNGDEMNVVINEDTGEVYITMTSYPTNEDSDGDGANDDVDPAKLCLPYFGELDYFIDLAERLNNSEYVKDNNISGIAYNNLLLQNVNTEYYDILIGLMIDDLNIYNSYHWVPDDDWDNFCEFFNYCVLKVFDITSEKHYIRNKLNRAPMTLEDMIYEYENWILCNVSASSFHMAGDDGEYNLKFISKCGKYEAVYNKNGELLTESNDPANMGTYNYANFTTRPIIHGILDVLLYNKLGNIPNVPANKASTETYDANISAQNYHNDIQELLENDCDISIKLNKYKEIVNTYVK